MTEARVITTDTAAGSDIATLEHRDVWVRGDSRWLAISAHVTRC